METEDYIWSVFGNIHSWTHALSLGVSSLLPWHTLPWAGLWPLVVRGRFKLQHQWPVYSRPSEHTVYTHISALWPEIFPLPCPSRLSNPLSRARARFTARDQPPHTLQKGAGDPELQRRIWAGAQTPFLWNPLALTAGKLGSNHVFPWLGRKSHSLQKYQFWDHSENSD